MGPTIPGSLRPFFLDLKSISDPDVRKLAVTILSVAAVHYARIVSADPALRLKPELLKAELLRKLQLFENSRRYSMSGPLEKTGGWI